MSAVQIYFDEEPYESLSGNTVLQAALSFGIEIPRFCYHEKLSIAGNCRMCLVEVAFPKSLKPMASCALPIVNNMVVFTNTMLVKKAREGVLEFLLANHPLDCPICDQGGECDLQDESMYYGGDRGRFYEEKRAVEDKECGPLIKTVMNRCIHCTRCVRYATEIAGVPILGVLGRGSKMEIGTYVKQLIDSEVSGNLIDLCPVGALTSKPYAFVARPWELRSHETIDIMDTICSRIRLDIRGSEVLRILPSLNEELNEDWITDKTRFFYDSLKKQRLYSPLVRIGSNFIPVNWETAFSISSKFLSFYISSNKVFQTSISSFYMNNFVASQNLSFVGFFGDLVDFETIMVLRDFFFEFGSDSLFYQNPLHFSDELDFRSFYLFNVSLAEIERIDFCGLFGLNPRLELPLLNLRLRKSFLNSSSVIFSFGFSSGLTYTCFQEGNTYNSILQFLTGKLYSSKRLIEAKLPLILVGREVLNFVPQTFFLGAFFSLLKFSSLYLDGRWFGLNFLTVNVSSLISKELGVSVKKFEYNYFKSGSFFYLTGVEDFLNTSSLCLSNSFLVYQGHTGDAIALKSDIVFPGATFIEKESCFLNLEGKVQKTKYIMAPPYFSRTDWKIINAFKLFFLRNYVFSKIKSDTKVRFLEEKAFKLFKNIKQVRERGGFLAPLFKGYKFRNRTDLNWRGFWIAGIGNYFRGWSWKYRIGAGILSANTENYFFSNSLTRVSRTLSLCSSRFKSRQINFVA
jgi:NADH dehydrogenase (ubiquinone) Fe-S protein 1